MNLYSDYIYLSKPVYVTHSAGKYAAKRFRKASCPIIERLTNSLMMHGRNNGKKLMAVRIVDHAFEIVSATTQERSSHESLSPPSLRIEDAYTQRAHKI